MNDRRVVVTGMGVLSPIGNSPEAVWKSLSEGRSGIDLISSFDTEGYASRIGGEVKDFTAADYFSNPKDARRADRYAQLGVAAARIAIDNCGVDLSTVDLTRFGVMLGSGIGGLQTLEGQHSALLKRGPAKVSPFLIPMMIPNIASGMVSMEHGLAGPNMCIVTACATANNSIGEAWRIIKFGDADAFLAGGAEASIAPTGLAGFSAMRALSTRNDEPTKASRPFDKDRDGFVMGEGAGVVVLEELEHAKKRGAHIYCELSGYGVSADAHHLTSPHPEGSGASRCMNMALNHAGLNPEDVQYVNAHGTSTGLGDIGETLAIKQTFGDHAKNGLVVSSTKSMTGHLLGAAGGVELIASILAIQNQTVPPTINLDEADEQCDLDYVPHEAREVKIKAIASNSFGFGGHNGTLIAEKFE
ncbi:MAG: beta-ketoacyl-ACP synthase II [Verrucomicrobiota bacterium]